MPRVVQNGGNGDGAGRHGNTSASTLTMLEEMHDMPLIGTFADDDDDEEEEEGSDVSDDEDEDDLMGDTGPQQQPSPHTALDECVRLLNSSTDEQRFVGLLLATKQVKSQADLTMIFDAGMPFVHRLLLTPGGGNSEDSDACSPYRALALSVLASFASSPELVARYAFSRCAPTVGSLLQELDERRMSEDELRNCSAVLVALLRPPHGFAGVHGHLMHQDVAPTAARAVEESPPAAEANSATAAAAACTVLEELATAYAGAAGVDSGAAGAGASSGSMASETVPMLAAVELLVSACILAPAVHSLKDALALTRLRALRSLVEGGAAQLEDGRARRAARKAAAAKAAAAHPAARKAAKAAERRAEDPRVAAAKAKAAKAAAGLEAERRAADAELGKNTAEEEECDEEAQEAAAADAATKGAEGALRMLAPRLRSALGVPMASKLTPAARSDVLRAAATATQLCGPTWIIEPPSGNSGGDSNGSDNGGGGGGSMLTLLLQLCSVELQMCLYDQPADDVSTECLEVMPACCALLEEALFRLHSDADEEEDEAEDSAPGGGEDPWLAALSDAQVVSAQQAFQRALMVSLEYLETIRTEQAERDAADSKGEGSGAAPPPHCLLPPVARLVSAWLAQPSAPQMMELYDRGAARGQKTARTPADIFLVFLS